MQTSKDTPNTNPSFPVGHLRYDQKCSASDSASRVYEGFTFSKAMLEQSSTWICAKRTDMHRNQDEYFKMVHEGANQQSVAQQYQSISSDIRRAHVNQLIAEQRHNNPLVEWSCVYVKEHTQMFEAGNSRCAYYETVSMDVIIMQRPMKTQVHSRTSMGGPVATRKTFRPDTKSSFMCSRHRDISLTPDQNGKINAINSSGMSFEDTLDCSSESNSDPDDASMLSDQSDETSATDDRERMETETETGTETECQEPRPNQVFVQKQNASPYRREPSHGLHFRRKSQGCSGSLERRHGRNYLRDQFEVSPVKILGPRWAERVWSGSVPSRRYRMQVMNDNEIRSRMLDHREACLGHREQWLKRAFSEARQLERPQPVTDLPTVCRCTCRCAIKEDV